MQETLRTLLTMSRKSRGNASQKKSDFWKAIRTQKMQTLRYGLTNAGIEAHTCGAEGLTSIMVAAALNKPKSLSAILDFYERRRIMRPKGWIDLRDDGGRTALMMAAANGNADCVRLLLFHAPSAEKAVALKCDRGLTARDYALQRKKKDCLDVIDDAVAPSDDEDDDAGGGAAVPADGLTSTERSRLKKKQLAAAEGETQQQKLQKARQKRAQASFTDRTDDLQAVVKGAPPALWPEAKEVVASVLDKRAPQHELNVIRPVEGTGAFEDYAEGHAGGVDPCVWHLVHLHRLQLRFPASPDPRALCVLPGGVARLAALQTLILSHNALTALPEAVGALQDLRVLEVQHNKIGPRLPAALATLAKLNARFLLSRLFAFFFIHVPLRARAAVICVPDDESTTISSRITPNI